MRFSFVGLMVLWLSAAFVSLAARAETLQPDESAVVWREDFEHAEGIGERWTAQGPLTASRQSVEAGVSIDGVSGRVLDLKAEGRAALVSQPLVAAARLPACERLVLRVRAEAAAPAAPVVVEIQFHSGQRRAWWWRKLEVAPNGWQQVAVPLRFFRASTGAAPAWEEVDRLALYFRGGGHLLVDGLELIDQQPDETAYLSPQELGSLAFGEAAAVRSLERKPFVVITDAPQLDEAPVLDAIQAMHRRLQQEFPNLPAPRRPVVLLVFAEESAYRAFWPRYAQHFNSESPPPRSDGYTAMGVATTFHSAQRGPVRPVYVHEICHALCEQLLGLGNSGEWLQEAMANRYALDVSRQDLSPLVRQGLDDASARSPLAELLNGEPIALNRYWQAVSVLDWLLADEARRQKLGAALPEFKRRGTTDLRPLAETHFGLTLDQMDQAWRQWAAAGGDSADEKP